MELYILRHGIAEEARAGQSDSDRALLPDGKRKVRALLRLAREADVAPTLIMTSPFKRAVQTAQIAAEELGYKADLLRTKALVPAGSPPSVWEEIRIHKSESQLLLAGHEPLFSNLTAYLLACPNLQMDFKKGALVRLDIERFSAQPQAVLKWMLVPKLVPGK
jgi:phosphohistidine phosphatase